MFIDLGITNTEIISKQIADKSNQGAAQAEFISTVLSEWETSATRLYMNTAEKYYSAKNDILEAKRMIIGRDPTTLEPVLMESKVLSNNTLSHNFLKKLTRQKIAYMIGKPYTLAATIKDDPTAKAFIDALVPYTNDEFFKKFKNTARDSIIKKLGWMLAYYDEEGNLKFKRIAPEEVVPLWADSDHTILDAVIRTYKVEHYSGGKKDIIKFVDYYNNDGVYHYKYNADNKLVPMEDIPFENNFYVMKKNDVGEDLALGVNWARIPFIPFKYDSDEQCLLERIKTLVDDYDKKTSGIANNIDDFPNSMLVIKNYDAGNKEEFIQHKNQFRTIFVQGDGDANVLETPLNIEDIDKHLARLQRDIYEFGQGVNTVDKDIKETSGIALRFIYADLDMDCVDWGSELEWSLKQMYWFIQQDILNKGGADYTAVDYKVVFNTDIIINETETINNCAISAGIISDKTIAENHPWVTDADKEIAAAKQDMISELQIDKTYGAHPAPGKK